MAFSNVLPLWVFEVDAQRKALSDEEFLLWLKNDPHIPTHVYENWARELRWEDNE